MRARVGERHGKDEEFGGPGARHQKLLSLFQNFLHATRKEPKDLQVKAGHLGCHADRVSRQAKGDISFHSQPD